MGVRLDHDIIRLEGRCQAADAEPLFGWLQAQEGRIVDLAAAEYLHTAVIQVLIALRPALGGACEDPFLRDWIIPILQVDAVASTLVESS